MGFITQTHYQYYNTSQKFSATAGQTGFTLTFDPLPTADSKFKIFIIDEVHMLSKQAFNALLKTLEEPPKYLKFIFETTEVKKIPITVISRCQRYDLSRINSEELFNYLKNITQLNLEIHWFLD